jgi:predicted nucleic-acid-binding protein
VIGLDSNVLVRYLTQDDPLQSRKADELIEQALSAGEPLYLNHIVLCELSWVLGRAYGYDSAELAETIEAILAAAQFVFEDKDLLWQALAAFRASGADFADCVIAARNASAGCVKTLTFDKRAGRVPQFSLS